MFLASAWLPAPDLNFSLDNILEEPSTINLPAEVRPSFAALVGFGTEIESTGTGPTKSSRGFLSGGIFSRSNLIMPKSP